MPHSSGLIQETQPKSKESFSVSRRKQRIIDTPSTSVGKTGLDRGTVEARQACPFRRPAETTATPAPMTIRMLTVKMAKARTS